MTKLINHNLSGINMKLKNLALISSLCGLLTLSNKSFSQENPEDQIGKTGFYPGCQIGWIMNRVIQDKIGDFSLGRTQGITFGLYAHNDKLQVGYIAEINKKDIEGDFSGNGIDLGKMGVEIEYFPISGQKIKPYIGSEIKYEDESLSATNQNRDSKSRGVGLELKLGTEIKPVVNRKIRGYLDLGYNFSLSKKSKNYPENPKVIRDKFLVAAGIKF
jgi:hypothetical protein